jgi:hypothetical protein
MMLQLPRMPTDMDLRRVEEPLEVVLMWSGCTVRFLMLLSRLGETNVVLWPDCSSPIACTGFRINSVDISFECDIWSFESVTIRIVCTWC